MSFPAYPEYKNSGVGWLGDVPASWGVRRLGSQFQERKQTVSDVDYQPLSVTKEGIVPQLETAAKTDNGDNRKLVKAGDFVINSRSDRKGSAGISSLDGSVSLISTVLHPRSLRPRFTHHLLRSGGFQEEFYRYGTGIVADLWSTRYSAMKMINLPIPSTREQQLIADFLDGETAKIDALISKQEQLIATLREDRIATITHAVTKGLDPNVEMKDSSVEWLGEIPAAWVAMPLKYQGSLVTGGTPPSGEVGHFTNDPDIGFPWFRPDDLDQSGLPSLASRFLSPSGSALMSRLNAPSVHVVSIGATLAKVGFVDRLSSSNQQITALVDSECPKFLFYALTAARDPIWAASMGNTLPIINASRLGAVQLPVPPVDEQQRICEYLDAHCAKLDAVIAKSEQMIETLREYRSALITDAVTGKIDVRGVA